MNKLVITGVIFASLALAACGGGSGGGITPAPSSTPAKYVGYSVNQIVPQARYRSPQLSQLVSCQASPPKVALQALDGYSPDTSWSAFLGSEVTAIEYDTSCKPLPTQAQYAIANQAIASTTKTALPDRALPSPSPGSVILTGHKHGATTVNVTFSDGTTSAVPVAVYDEMGVGCDSFYAGPLIGDVQLGWTPDGPVYNAADTCGRTYNTIAPSDIHVDQSAGTLDFPYGYQVVDVGADMPVLPTVTDCSSFTSQGTQAFYDGNPHAGYPPNLPMTPPYVLLFKTSGGLCVKVWVFHQSASDGVTIAGLYAVSDASGKFPY